MKNKLSSEYRIKKALCKSDSKDVSFKEGEEFRDKKTINTRKHDKR